MLGVVADRGPLEALVDEVEADDPELAAEALVELAQSYWVEWRMKQATQCAHRAMAIADEHDDHSAYARAAAALSVPQWARYDLRGSLATLRGRRRTRPRRARRLAARGRPGVPGAARAHVARAPRRSRDPRARVLATSPSGRSTRSSSGCRSPRSPRSRWHAASSTTPSSTRTARCSCSGCRATTGPPACSCLRSRARTSPAASSSRPATRSPRGRRRPTSSSRRASTCSPGGSTRASAASPCRVRRCPRSHATRWSAPTRGRRWRWSSRSARARPATSRSPTTSWSEIEERGGVLIGGTATLAARHLGVAQDLLGDEDAAVATLRRAIAVGRELRAAPERARAQTDLGGDPAAPRRAVATRSSCSTRRSPRSASWAWSRRRARAAQLSGTDGSRDPGASRSRANATSIILFTDVVDSTRLTEELGAAHYRGPRPAWSSGRSPVRSSPTAARS